MSPPNPETSNRPILQSLLVAAAMLGFSAVGCATSDASVRPFNLRGTVMETPVEKVEFTLPDTEGRPFHFRDRTDGSLTLLFFGYTYCPDVCPVHLANIAAALRDLPYDDRSRIRVVFVSTDPERDTARRIREWLDAFDRSFVGLRGPLDEVNRIQAGFGLGPASQIPGTEGVLPDSSGYLVQHAAQVLAFSPHDNVARVAYPFGARQADWRHDLPILLSLEW